MFRLGNVCQNGAQISKTTISGKLSGGYTAKRMEEFQMSVIWHEFRTRVARE